jgi:hypothetical protein
MTSQPPATVADFKAYFVRDFKYGDGTDRVTDADISRAISEAVGLYNPALFTTEIGKTAFLYAAAHFLVTNVQAAGGLQGRPEGLGIDNQAQGILSSKSVGGVNISLVEPPDFVKRSAPLQQFWLTDYGKRYLSYLGPRIIGAIGAVEGPLQVGEGGANIPFTDY